MPVWAWVCLGIFLVLVVPASLAALVAGFRLWKRLASMQQTVGRPLEMLAVKVEELNAHSAATGGRAESVTVGLAELNRALEKMSVLSWALGDVRGALGLWRSLTRAK